LTRHSYFANELLAHEARRRATKIAKTPKKTKLLIFSVFSGLFVADHLGSGLSRVGAY